MSGTPKNAPGAKLSRRGFLQIGAAAGAAVAVGPVPAASNVASGIVETAKDVGAPVGDAEAIVIRKMARQLPEAAQAMLDASHRIHKTLEDDQFSKVPAPVALFKRESNDPEVQRTLGSGLINQNITNFGYLVWQEVSHATAISDYRITT